MKPAEPRSGAGRIITVSLRFGIGVLFIYAGAMKALDPAGFLTDIQNYRLLPHLGSAALALYLPWLEIVAGSCVIVRKFYPGALVVLLGLMVLFIGALLSAWVRGLDIACGCFGSEQGTMNYPWILLRDLAILATIVALGRAACVLTWNTTHN